MSEGPQRSFIFSYIMIVALSQFTICYFNHNANVVLYDLGATLLNECNLSKTSKYTVKLYFTVLIYNLPTSSLGGLLHTQCPRLWSYRVILNQFTTLCGLDQQRHECVGFWVSHHIFWCRFSVLTFPLKDSHNIHIYRSNSFAKSCTSINCTFY